MMMSSTFSIFDPSMQLFSLSWMLLPLAIVMVLPIFWMNSYFKMFFTMVMSSTMKEINNNMKDSQKGVHTMIISTMMIIFLLNIMSMFPYMFSITSHMVFNLPMAFTMWLSIVMFLATKFTKDFMTHLTPSGTPTPLMSFMVIIELVSNLMRPLSLTFRLTANMIAGHLLMTLISNFILNLTLIKFTISMVFLQSMMVMMEMGVSFIQAYVFSILLLLYMKE